jgi:hypothetical protein
MIGLLAQEEFTVIKDHFTNTRTCFAFAKQEMQVKVIYGKKCSATCIIALPVLLSQN